MKIRQQSQENLRNSNGSMNRMPVIKYNRQHEIGSRGQKEHPPTKYLKSQIPTMREKNQPAFSNVQRFKSSEPSGFLSNNSRVLERQQTQEFQRPPWQFGSPGKEQNVIPLKKRSQQQQRKAQGPNFLTSKMYQTNTDYIEQKQLNDMYTMQSFQASNPHAGDIQINQDFEAAASSLNTKSYEPSKSSLQKLDEYVKPVASLDHSQWRTTSITRNKQEKALKINGTVDNLQIFEYAKKMDLKQIANSLEPVSNRKNSRVKIFGGGTKNDFSQTWQTFYSSTKRANSSMLSKAPSQHHLSRNLINHYGTAQELSEVKQGCQASNLSYYQNGTMSGGIVNSNNPERKVQIKMTNYKTPKESLVSVMQKIAMHKPGTGVILKPKQSPIVKNNFQGSVAFDAELLMDPKHSNAPPSQSAFSLSSPYKMQLSTIKDQKKAVQVAAALNRRSTTQPNMDQRQTLRESVDTENLKKHLTEQLDETNFDSKKTSNMAKRNAMLVRLSETHAFQDQLSLGAADDVHMDKYFLKTNLNKVIKFLEEQSDQRKQQNIVEHKIKQAADLTNCDLEQFREDINKYKQLQKLSCECQDKFESSSPNNRSCSVSKLARSFYTSADRPTHSHRQAFCKHDKSEEDKLLDFIDCYQWFMQFKNLLKNTKNNKKAMDQMFGKIEKQPQLQITQTMSEEQMQLRKNSFQFRPVLNSDVYQSKSSHKLSISARKIIEQIQVKIDEEIEEIRQTLNDPNNDDEFCIFDKNRPNGHSTKQQLLQRLEQATLMIPKRQENKVGKKLNYSDTEQLLKYQNSQEYIKEHGRSKFVNLQQKSLINSQELFRLNYIQQGMISEVLQLRKPRVKKDIVVKEPPEEIPENKVGQNASRKWKSERDKKKEEELKIKLEAEKIKAQQKIISGFDDAISMKTSDLILLNNKISKEQKLFQSELIQSQVKELVSYRSSHDNQTTNTSHATSPQRTDRIVPDLINDSKNIFHDIDTYKEFYRTAKHQITGKNLEPTKESEFYRLCRNEFGGLPQPIYKCMKNNQFKLQGKNLNQYGYAKAISHLIQQNNEIGLHLLQIHIDDCAMSDEQFSTILNAILASKTFKTTLQTIFYSKNQMGPLSTRCIGRFLQDLDVYSCLKELNLTNLQIRVSDLRLLTEYLSKSETEENCPRLQKLQIQNINLNDLIVVNQLCKYIDISPTLRHLILSNCLLQMKQIHQITKSLSQKYLFKTIDLSGNVLREAKTIVFAKPEPKSKKDAKSKKGAKKAPGKSKSPSKKEPPKKIEIKPKKKNAGEVTIDDIVENLKTIVSSDNGLQFLNLCGMRIGNKLMPFIMSVRENRSLNVLNLSHNQLTQLDQEFIYTLLGFTEKDLGRNLKINMLLENDMFFKGAFEQLKIEHKNIQFGSGDTERNQATAQMVNQAIIRELRADKQIDRAAQNGLLCQNISEVGALATNQGENIILQRHLYNPEFIFNEVGRDLLEVNDFNKPMKWEKVDQMIDTSQSCQYILVLIDPENIESDFHLIQDAKMIKTLKKVYSLGSEYVSRDNEGARNFPVVFGTMTQWRAYQALKLYQYITAASVHNGLDRSTLNDYVFDEINYDLTRDFPQTAANLWNTLISIVNVKEAQIIGMDLKEFENKVQNLTAQGSTMEKLMKKQKNMQIEAMRNNYAYSMFVPPGKHSIFVYDPISENFYLKVIVVDVKTGIEDTYFKNSCEMRPVQHTETEPRVDTTVSDRIFLAYLNDSNTGNLDIYHITQDKDQLITVLQSIQKDYGKLLQIFQMLQIMCPETYPLISKQKLAEVYPQLQIFPKKNKDNSESEDEKVLKDISEFQTLNRPQFIKFLVWICSQQHDSGLHICYFGYFLEKTIFHILEGLPDDTTKEDLKNDEQIQNLVMMNYIPLHTFLSDASFIYGFSATIAQQIIKEKMPQFEKYLSTKKIFEFYVKSLGIVTNDQTSSRNYNNYTHTELIEFIYRISQFIYDANNYPESERTNKANKEINQYFEETAYIKFKETVKLLLCASFVDPEPKSSKKGEKK